MSSITGILTGAKAAIEGSTVLSDSDVFMREPLLQDNNITKRTIFVYIDSPRPGEPNLVLTNSFRIYRVNIQTRSIAYGRTDDPDVSDALVIEKGIINDAILNAIATCMPGQVNEITGVYHVEWVNEDQNYNETLTKNGIDIGANKISILQQWDFHTAQ
jgi:hypothetical protein